ncbi:MAG: trimethylamine methyltransferase family protein [Planctomycetota bacterium]
MGKITYALTGGLDQGQLDGIRGEALAILERTGVEVDHEGIRKHLADFEGVEIKGKRVCYSRALVEKWIARIREDNLEYSYNRTDSKAFRLSGPYMARWYIDPENGERRYGTPDDLALSAQLMDAYGAYGPSPMHVQTVRPELRQLVTLKTCLLNSREIGGWGPAADAFDTEYLCRIGEAAGRKPPYGAMEIPISPLKLNHEALSLIFERRGRPNQFTGIVYGGGAVPMPGATAPIRIPGCLVQGLAEAIAAYMTPKLIDERIPGYCSFGGFLFDMKTMNTGMFFPESLVYGCVSRQVIEHVLGRTMGFHFRCGDFERPGDVFRDGFTAAVDALAGARTFLGAGEAPGESFAPHAFVIHADIMRHVEKFVMGLDGGEGEWTTLELIEHGVRSGMYLDHPSALEYRTAYLEPELMFRYENVKELVEGAREKVRETLRAHRFELPAERKRDVEEVYASAVREIERKGRMHEG